MGRLRGRSEARDRRRLEQALRACLPSLGRPVEIAQWVLTGLPANIDLKPVSVGSAILGTPEQRQAIWAAAQSVEPIVEWRLGLLYAAEIWAVDGPTQALHGLRRANGAWPDDQRIMDMLAAAGVSEAEHLADLLIVFPWRTHDVREELRRRPSFDRLVCEHPDVVRTRLAGDANQVGGLAMVLSSATPETLSLYSDEIASLMTSASKKRRAEGAKLGSHMGYQLLATGLQALAASAKASVRAEAIRSLGRLAGDEHRSEVIAFCEASCWDDRSAAVQSAIEELATLETETGTGYDVPLPEPDRTPPDDAAREAYSRLFDRAYEDEQARYQKAQQWLRANPNAPQYNWAQKVSPAKRMTKKSVKRGWRYICEGGEVPEALFQGTLVHRHLFGTLGELKPLHALRLLRIAGDQPRGTFTSHLEQYRDTGHPTPLELQAAAEDVGFDRKEILRTSPSQLPWSAEDTWPWVAALLPDFIDAISGGAQRWERVDKYYEAVGCLPVMPRELRELLLSIAVTGPKGHRPLAKAALANQEKLLLSIVDLVASRKYEERAEAALWLAELGAVEAIEALHEAAAKEQHDVAKSALLTSLERLGEPIDRYLDRQSLLREAEKGLTKKLPSAASWIPLDSLPSLRWDENSPVDPSIVEWLVVSAVRLKSASPSPMVRRYLDQMNREDVEAFADVVLAMWLTEDARPISHETATERAREELQLVRRSPQWYSDLAPLTDDEIVSRLLPSHLGTPAGSAIASKGVLSLVAAGGGLAVVAPTEAFLKKWYGRRSNQCKALVEMLSWVEDPSAIQLVLSVGHRFRTKGIQQEALRQAELLAERKGWTLEDLAYRTIPSGGFNAGGSLAIDYGERRFTASLADDLSIILTNADGKMLKALPAARKTEDAEAVKLAKKELSGAKKQIKRAAKEQPLRLHEAMCVQRSFEVDDYRRFVLEHPVMARLATRLVWAAVDLKGRRTLFRPLSDGTLVSESDDEVFLTSSMKVRLAHAAIDGEAIGVAWNQHLVDYEVAPLFPQFGRPQLPQLSSDQEKLTECRGAVLDDRRLRSALQKTGFEIGPGEDGTAVAFVRRPVRSAELEARISVRGLRVMIMEHDVALEDLHFGPLDGAETIKLEDVPKVLLIETIADVADIVAVSDGIVEDWEDRVPW